MSFDITNRRPRSFAPCVHRRRWRTTSANRPPPRSAPGCEAIPRRFSTNPVACAPAARSARSCPSAGVRQIFYGCLPSVNSTSRARSSHCSSSSIFCNDQATNKRRLFACEWNSRSSIQPVLEMTLHLWPRWYSETGSHSCCRARSSWICTGFPGPEINPFLHQSSMRLVVLPLLLRSARPCALAARIALLAVGNHRSIPVRAIEGAYFVLDLNRDAQSERESASGV